MGFRGRFSGLNLQIGSSLRSHGLVTFCKSEGFRLRFSRIVAAFLVGLKLERVCASIQGFLYG